MSKTAKVLQHLIEKGSITSWEAIREYKATRLSAIIFELRKKHYIVTVNHYADNEDGKQYPYAEYKYLGTIQKKIIKIIKKLLTSFFKFANMYL